MREMVKLAFNLTLQGKPVGDHDETIPCIRGGSARVFGRATSNPVQGATEVHLTYVLDSCAYVQNDVDAAENYDMTLTGTIIQDGVLAVQPTATTALRFTSESLTWSGTVSDPPTPYEAPACVVDLQQNGNLVAGMLCGRTASFTF